ncbi:response regulator [Sphingomonas aurantiaca]|uniref:response regulator n=1 Tax=Sphingomonas aurantiaca TaxID=185949 RepID=UPI003A5C2B47
MKLLLIEDDAQTADYVRRGLVELGNVSDHAATGIDGLTAAIVGRYDAIILDRNLPELDGLSVLKALRAKGDRTPVLLLSALGQVDDRIAGLQAGSDDYLAKPFSFGEARCAPGGDSPSPERHRHDARYPPDRVVDTRPARPHGHAQRPAYRTAQQGVSACSTI